LIGAISRNVDAAPSGEFDSGIIMESSSFTYNLNKARTLTTIGLCHPKIADHLVVG